MAELLFSPALWWAATAGAVLFAALAALHEKLSWLWGPLSVLCAAGAVLLDRKSVV